MSFALDKFWRFCAHLSINSKEYGTIKLSKPYGPQRWAMREVARGLDEGIHEFINLKCYDPSMRVLTADLRWRAIGDLGIGDEVVAFDEASGAQERKMRTAKVLASTRSLQQSYRVTLDNGIALIVSADHRHLVAQRGGKLLQWRPVSWLRPGDRLRKITDPWSRDYTDDYHDGWMGGFLDGEGHLRNITGHSTGLCVSQLPGEVLDRAKTYLTNRGYSFSEDMDKSFDRVGKFGRKPVHRLCVGRMNEMFRLIGTTRPTRFIGTRWWEGRGLPGKRSGDAWAGVLTIEKLGVREMVDIETSTETFVCEGFAAHNCRQIGLSTVFLALDLYWPFTHQGLDGLIVVHDQKTFVNFRTMLTEYYNSLPRRFKPQSPTHNVNEFVFRFPSQVISRLMYEIAGTRASGDTKLGRAKGAAYLHATEMAFWGDQIAYQSLRNALAEVNPKRLYVWESTANGFNGFEEQWRGARREANTSQRAIFVSWWAHELYRLKPDDNRYAVYWGSSGKLTAEERVLVRDVELLYPDAMQFVNGTKTISSEQIAWMRWYSEEKVGDPEMVLQEMPWTEHQAFVTTGSQFFPSRNLTEAHKRIVKEPSPRYLRVETQHTMTDSKIIECPPRVANLLIYEMPVEKAYYVLGADPAYGSSDWADRFVISVWRAYSDRCEQVAEYCTADTLPYAFAWVIAYLAGCYAPCAWNLEVNGPGAAVMSEIDNLRRQRFAARDPKDRKTMQNFLGGMQEFLYSRVDSMGRTPTARGTQSTLQTKRRYFDHYRDYFCRGMVVPHSRELIEEMKWVQVEPGCAPAGSARHKDDRVVGGCLAIQHWHEKLRTKLMYENVTYQRTSTEPQRRITTFEALVARQRKLLGM